LNKVKKELVKHAPKPLWKVVTDKQYRYIFEKHILSKLDELSFRLFREVNTESRDAIRRSKRKLKETYEYGNWGVGRYPPKVTIETRKLDKKELQYYFCREAGRLGSLGLLRWLREEKKFLWDEMTINAAAQHGHLHIVKYCMEQKCMHDELVCAFAAKNGHLNILKYLHENGAPWDSWTCAFARENNHLDCLLYALDNRCPNDKHRNQ